MRRSGSSARKLKRSGTNLLAGRAIVTEMFLLTSAELGGDFDPSELLVRGSLPLAVAGTDAQGFLSAYAMTYLNEEIRAEALTRNVGAFSRFLEVAARQNGQITNMTNISREAAVARTTVQTYFGILVDTLIGYWVPAWDLKHGTRHYSQPKFYLLDTGMRLQRNPAHSSRRCCSTKSARISRIQGSATSHTIGEPRTEPR